MSSEAAQGWIGSPVEHVAAPMEGWTAMLLNSGILFWLGGLLAWVPQTAWWQQPEKWLELWEKVKHLEPVPTLLIIFGIMLFVGAVASLLKYFDLTLLRFLEGYYYPSDLRRRWIKVQDWWWVRQKQIRLQELAQKAPASFTPQDREEKVRLDWELMFIPDPLEQRMPTRLGNLLRSVELRPEERYGLNAFICWPPLWVLLPSTMRMEVTQARSHLDTMVRIWTWGLLFSIWGLWAWWAWIVSLVTILIAYRWILQAAEEYGKLVMTSFDLYRSLLYQSLRWPLPSSPAEEIAQGHALATYLWRGFGPEGMRFTAGGGQEEK